MATAATMVAAAMQERRKTRFKEELFQKFRKHDFFNPNTPAPLFGAPPPDPRDLKAIIDIYVDAGIIPLSLRSSDADIAEPNIFRHLAHASDSMSYWALHEDGCLKRSELLFGEILSFTNDAPRLFDLPKSIKNMKELKELTLYNCRSIPEELSQLHFLYTLTIINLTKDTRPENETRSTFPPSTLPSLARLDIRHSGRLTAGIESKLLRWLTESELPNLGEIHVEAKTDNFSHVSEVFEALTANPSICKVHRILICAWDDNFFPQNDWFADFLLKTLPQTWPRLERLEASTDSSILPLLIERLDEGRYHSSLESTLCESLQELHLWCGDAQASIQEKRNTVKLLQRFRRLCRIGDIRKLLPFSDERKSPNNPSLDRQIDYLLRINRGGGRLPIPVTAMLPSGLLEKDSGITLHHSPDTLPKRIPLSLWPRVIERAGRDVTPEKYPKLLTPFDATAVYRMLRPNTNLLGPALGGILDQSTAQTECHLTLTRGESNDDDTDDNAWGEMVLFCQSEDGQIGMLPLTKFLSGCFLYIGLVMFYVNVIVHSFGDRVSTFSYEDSSLFGSILSWLWLCVSHFSATHIAKKVSDELIMPFIDGGRTVVVRRAAVGVVALGDGMVRLAGGIKTMGNCISDAARRFLDQSQFDETDANAL